MKYQVLFSLQKQITLLLINSGFKKETMTHRKLMSLISLSKEFKIQSCMHVNLGKLRTFNSKIIQKDNHNK